MGNTVSIHREDEPENMTISGLIKLSNDVGKNTSDIQKLKEQTDGLTGLRTEVEAVKINQTLTDQKLDQLAINDSRIEATLKSINSGTSKFRYSLWGAVVVIFACIFGTLTFGLSLTEKSQMSLEKNLQKQISDSDKNLQKQISDGNERHTENYRDISQQIRELGEKINKRGNE
jgi:predicted  nucleic acid-binding Zn-ribbon protein